MEAQKIANSQSSPKKEEQTSWLKYIMKFFKQHSTGIKTDI